MDNELEKKIEALLFVSGEPMSIQKLSKLLKRGKEEILEAMIELEAGLSGRGIRVLNKDNSYMLSTAPELFDIVQDFMKEEIGEELSRATLETLSVVVYKGPLSRAQIDYIRGVNSNFTIRNLMIRGFVDRKPDPKDSRSWLYSPSFEFLKYMGIEKLENLTGYDEFKKEMENLLKNQENTKENE